MERAMDKAAEALKLAEDYLVERGIGHRGTVGRTMVLPAIRDARAAIAEELAQAPISCAECKEDFAQSQKPEDGSLIEELERWTKSFVALDDELGNRAIRDIQKILSKHKPTWPLAGTVDVIKALYGWCEHGIPMDPKHSCGPESCCDNDCVSWHYFCGDMERARKYLKSTEDKKCL